MIWWLVCGLQTENHWTSDTTYLENVHKTPGFVHDELNETKFAHAKIKVEKTEQKHEHCFLFKDKYEMQQCEMEKKHKEDLKLMSSDVDKDKLLKDFEN